MRIAPAIAFLVLPLSAPAFATGGMSCAPTNGRGPSLSLVIGHTVAPQIISVTLRDGGRVYGSGGKAAGSKLLPIVVAQSWRDDRNLWVDLVDAGAMRYEGKLRARFQPRVRSRPAVGTFVRNGRTYRMRCVEA